MMEMAAVSSERSKVDIYHLQDHFLSSSLRGCRLVNRWALDSCCQLQGSTPLGSPGHGYGATAWSRDF
jgi:hypothetical protein